MEKSFKRQARDINMHIKEAACLLNSGKGVKNMVFYPTVKTKLR
jgi:hypothetical protein